ncbi:hypothetical protein THAOC_15227, partial [Thalassiosira oceanica]
TVDTLHLQARTSRERGSFSSNPKLLEIRLALKAESQAAAAAAAARTHQKARNPTRTKHGKVDHLAMANIGRRCTMEVAEECNPEQNRPLVPILASAKAVDTGNTDDFGLEVERRSTPRNYTSRRTPPFEA